MHGTATGLCSCSSHHKKQPLLYRVAGERPLATGCIAENTYRVNFASLCVCVGVCVCVWCGWVWVCVCVGWVCVCGVGVCVCLWCGCECVFVVWVCVCCPYSSADNVTLEIRIQTCQERNALSVLSHTCSRLEHRNLS